MSKFNGIKTDNAKNTSKINIRKMVLDKFDKSHVFDAFYGEGAMYDDVWYKADSHVGCDLRKIFTKKTKIHCGNNLKFIKANSMKRFNIFDLDAYGSPYEQMDEIIKKIQHNNIEKTAFCITDGVQMDLRMGRICKGLRVMTEINTSRVTSIYKEHDNLIKLVILNTARRLNKSVVFSKIAKGVTGSGMRYYAFILD